jgi:tetratricopeptide (TPR) repeat protein
MSALQPPLSMTRRLRRLVFGQFAAGPQAEGSPNRVLAKTVAPMLAVRTNKGYLPRLFVNHSLLGAVLGLVLYAPTTYGDFDPRGRRAKRPAASPASPAAKRPKTSLPNSPQAQSGDETRNPATQRPNDVLIARYTSAALQRPGDVFPLQRLAELYRERDGNLNSLVSEFEEKLSASPDNLGALLALGWFNFAEGRADAALALLTRAAKAHPDNPAPLLAIAAAHEQEGRTDEVALVLERVLPLQTNTSEREQTLRKLRSLALDRKDVEAAKGFHRELLSKAADSTFVRGELGRELLLRDLFTEATTEFERVARASVGDNRALAPVLLDLGRAQAGAQAPDAAIATLQKALSIAPRDSGLRRDVLTALVAVYRNANRLAEFIAYLERNRGSDFSQHVLLADLYVDAGRLEDGLKAYQAALQQNTRDIDTRIKLVRLLELRGDLKAAIAEYRKLIRLVPNQPQYVFQVADWLRKIGDRDGALRELDMLCNRASVDVDTLATAVDYYEQIGEQEKAQALLERVANSTTNPDHLVELGGRYFAAGDETRATLTWKRVVDLVPDKARAFHILGEVYLEHDLTALALEALNRAIELAPSNARYRRSLALALERTGASSARGVRLQRYAEAQRQWESLLTTSEVPNQKREARQHITTLWSLQGSLKDRVAPLEHAFRSRPQHLPSGRMLAEVYQRLNKLDDAERILRELTVLAPGDATTWSTLEQVLVNRHNLKAAIPIAERLVELEPKRAREHYQRLARYAADLYLDEDAIRYATKAVTLSPDDAEGYLRLGDMYRKREQVDLATQAYRKALNLNEHLHAACASLAELLYIQGKTGEADQLWRKLMRSALDEGLIQKAARASMQLNLEARTPTTLERELLPLALAYPQKPVYRSLLVELYAAWISPLVTTVATQRSGESRLQAQAELKAIGKRALKPLLDVLGDPAAHQHVTAIELLSQLRNPDANLPLLTYSTGEAPAPLRERALIALGLSGPNNVAKQLHELVFDGEHPRVDESDKVSLAAVWAYGRVTLPESAAQLSRLLQSDSPTAQVLSLTTLALRHNAALLDRLEPLLLAGNHPNTQAAAAFAVGQLLTSPNAGAKHSSLLTIVADLALTGTELVSATALTTLARLRHPAFPSAAAKALLSPSKELRTGAARATTAYFTAFEPDASFVRADKRLEPNEMLDSLLPSAPTAEQAVRALQLLADQLVLAAKAAYTKSESQSIAIAFAFTQSERLGFSPLTDLAQGADAELQRQGEDTARAIASSLVSEFSELGTHPSLQVRSAALRVLLRLDARHALDLIGKILATPNDPDAELVLAMLAHHPRQELVPNLVRLLDPACSWSIRRLAASTLTVTAVSKPATDDGVVASRLADRMVHDDNAFVREELVRAYAAWAASSARPELARLARVDREPTVRQAALKVLEDLP